MAQFENASTLDLLTENIKLLSKNELMH